MTALRVEIVVTTQGRLKRHNPLKRCESCGREYEPGTHDSKRRISRFCSRACTAQFKRDRGAATFTERFWARVDKAGPVPGHCQVLGPCWPWRGDISNTGYGRFVHMVAGSRVVHLAHRLAWQLVNGPIPQGLHCCHHCDNRQCVNPSHIFLGTDKDSMRFLQRGAPRGAQHWMVRRPELIPRGERIHSAKLNAANVVAIRKLHTAGVPHEALGRQFGVAGVTIGDIIAGRTWSHVP